MKRIIFSLTLCLLAASTKVWAQVESEKIRVEELPKKVIDKSYQVVKKFNQIDTTYIEEQHYNFTAMVQSTISFEEYTLKTSEGGLLEVAPDYNVKVGPYFGWRWIFMGITMDISHVSSSKRQDYNLSLYSNQVGVDLFYRKTGDEYKIRKLNLGSGFSDRAIRDVPFGGFRSSIKGANLYYIFNHKKFSYPAAFAQSTCQRRSCGTALAGIGYTRHSIELDVQKLADVVREHMGDDAASVLGTDLRSYKVKYTDISASGGYAYNWVFARNCLFTASLSAALGYKRTKSQNVEDRPQLNDFSVKNFNIDGVGRFALVYNNTRWYAGANYVFHTYNYEKSDFSTNSTFGSLNIYVGFNFQRR